MPDQTSSQTRKILREPNGRMLKYPRTVEFQKQHFMGYVKKEDSCWIWVGGRFDDGYGSYWFNEKNVHANRVSYLLFKGPIPTGMFVCHSCDNPTCVNPEHLWLGTQFENVRDKYNKGRAAVGEKCRQSHLTAQDVADMRTEKKLNPSTPYSAIASRFGISKCCTMRIIKGMSWSHLNSIYEPFKIDSRTRVFFILEDK